MPTIAEKAEQAIGKSLPSDGELLPEEQAAALPPEAGPLARILREPRAQAIIARYRQGDTQAIAAQRAYRFTGRVSIWARFIALVVGALALAPLQFWSSATAQTAAIVVQGAALITSYLAASWLAWRGLFSAWMHARVTAEIARLDLFEHVLAAGQEPRPGELPLLPLKLEYFRRFLLDSQIAYYKASRDEHLRAAGRTRVWKALYLAFIVLATAGILYTLGALGGGRQWGDEQTQRAVIAFMTLVSAVLATYSDISLMDMDERNATRYETTHANLARLRDEFLERVRLAAAEGNEAAVAAFTKLVQDQVSSEHREWVLIRDLAPRPDQELLARLPLVGERIAGKGPPTGQA
jgi:hypothetical protein